MIFDLICIILKTKNLTILTNVPAVTIVSMMPVFYNIAIIVGPGSTLLVTVNYTEMIRLPRMYSFADKIIVIWLVTVEKTTPKSQMR